MRGELIHVSLTSALLFRWFVLKILAYLKKKRRGDLKTLAVEYYVGFIVAIFLLGYLVYFLIDISST
jgi:uncharacterized membrane protein